MAYNPNHSPTGYFEPDVPSANATYRHGVPGDTDRRLEFRGRNQNFNLIDELRNIAENSEAVARAKHDVIISKRAARDEALNHKLHREQEAQRNGWSRPEREVAAENAAIEKLKEALEQAQAASADASRESGNDRAVLQAALALEGEYITAGPTVIIDTAPTPKIGKDYLAEGEKAQKLGSQLRGEKQTIAKARLPASEVEAILIADLDRLAEGGAPFMVAAGGRRPALRWPQSAVRAEPANIGEIPVAYDARAIAAWLHRDALVAEIRRQVAERYKDVDLALSESEKRQRIAQLDEQILAAERIEAAAILAAREAGYDIGFRAGMDPRAIIGVEGPAPTRRND